MYVCMYVCVYVCVYVCICVYVCVCGFVTNEDIKFVYWHRYDRYYKVKVTYEDIAPCPHFSKRL